MAKRFKRFRGQFRSREIGMPTVLRGQEYRSRLEARWANFFFHLDVAFRYEPKMMGRYVPDFELRIINWSRPLYVEIKPTVKSREECLQKFLHARPYSLITFVGNPPGDASFVENVRGQRPPKFGYCDMCGIVTLASECRCGEQADEKHAVILRAVELAMELNFTDISGDFEEFR